MSQLFGRTRPSKIDETIHRTKEKVIDLTKSLSDRQRYLKILIGRKKKNLLFSCKENVRLYFYKSRSAVC